ncbi:MAG: hypothetical protein D3906_06335 [Candidatus Electrothrix sp. AUS1_2]|nr:hypothetical protein [Candidatus Electrothrix sp. AUS1_2]
MPFAMPFSMGAIKSAVFSIIRRVAISVSVAMSSFAGYWKCLDNAWLRVDRADGDRANIETVWKVLHRKPHF